MVSALNGLRVIDLTTVLMGPFTTQLLGDFGADIIKVETLKGDNTRWIGPGRNPGMSGGFMGTNSSKRSIALDLKASEGRQALLDLVKNSDVLIYSMRPQAMARLGLEYQEMSALNPRLLYVGVFGYGRTGRYAAKPAYDDLIQALTGLPWLYGEASGTGEPRYVPAPIADKVMGIYAAMTVLAGLAAREQTGRGQQIDVPMFETFAQLILGNHLQGHNFEPPIAPLGYKRILSPMRKPYRTKDGFIAILPYNDRNWVDFFAAAGESDRYLSDPRFADISLRTENIDALYTMIADITPSRTTSEWLEVLDRVDVPAMPVNSLEMLLTDDHLADVGLISLVEHPTEGLLRTINTPTTWSDTPPVTTSPAPRLGQHTREILGEAGIAADRIDALIEQGIAVQAAGVSR